MALVKLFGETDMVFTSDGDKLIEPHKALVHEVVNGDYYLELEVYNSDLHYLTDKGIVAVKVKNGSWQGFRLGYSESMGDYTYFKCWHVSYDMKDYLIRDLDLDGRPYNVAVANMKNNTTRTNPFTFTTAVTTTVEMDIHNASLFDAIFALINATNTYIVRDNYNISLVANLGVDKEITVEPGKNLIALDKYEDVTNLVNELYPSVVFNDTEYGIVGDYIYDYSIYDHRYTKHVEFELFRPEYYSGMYGRYVLLTDKIDDLNALKESLTEKNEQLQSDLYRMEDEIADMRAEVHDLEMYYTKLMQTNSTILTSIYYDLTAALGDAYTAAKKKYDTVTTLVNKKKATLTQKEATLKDKDKLYDSYNSKSRSKKETAKAKEGYQKKAKEVKKEIDALRKEISTLKTAIRTHEKTQRKYKQELDRVVDYQEDLDDPLKVRESDIAKITTCLKAQGIQVICTMADDFFDAQEIVDDRDDYNRDVERKYTEIYRLQNKIDSTKDQITCNNKEYEDAEEEIDLLAPEAIEVMATLESEIRSDLLLQSNEHLNKYKYPQIAYEVESLPLDAGLGDLVQVTYPALGVDILTHVICIDYDCIAERIETLQFGNTQFTIADMMEQISAKQNEALVNSQVLLENGYSNMMSRISNLSGYVTAITTESVEDGRLEELDSRIEVNQGSAAMKVTETKLGEVVEAKVEVAKGQIESTVADVIVPAAMAKRGAYNLTVTVDGGLTYDDDNMVKTLVARVINNDQDITDELPDNAFSWTRKSTNAKSDVIWNSTGHYGSELDITSADYDDNCSFVCDVYINEEVILTDEDGAILTDLSVDLIATTPILVLRAEIALQSAFTELKSMIRQLADRITLSVNNQGKLVAVDINGNTQTVDIDSLLVRLTGALQSFNYLFNVSGSKLNLSDGSFDSKYLKWDAEGNVNIGGGGDINLTSSLTNDSKVSVTSGGNRADFGPVGAWCTEAEKLRSVYNVSGAFFYDVNEKLRSALDEVSLAFYNTSGTLIASFGPDGFDCSGDGEVRDLRADRDIWVNRDMCPLVDNKSYLGVSNLRWKQIYAVTSTISTSDSRLKKNPKEFDIRYVNFFMKLLPKLYQFIDGDSGRYHSGFYSQDVEDALEECGLTSLDFAGFIKSPVYAKDEEGNDTKEIIDYIYGLRQEEFIALITKVLQDAVKRQDSFDERLQVLEERLGD